MAVVDGPGGVQDRQDGIQMLEAIAFDDSLNQQGSIAWGCLLDGVDQG